MSQAQVEHRDPRELLDELAAIRVRNYGRSRGAARCTRGSGMNPRTVALGEVCQFVGGGTPSRKKAEFFSGDIPWATVKDFKTSRLEETEEYITEEGVAESATNIVEAGTVLLVTRIGLGKVAIAARGLAINQDIKGPIPRQDILPDYLFWFLLSRAPDIERMGTGATVKGVPYKYPCFENTAAPRRRAAAYR